MKRKTFALFLTIPFMLFFIFNGTNLLEAKEPIFESKSDMTTNTHQKHYYLIPENELSLPENEEFLQNRKYKLKNQHQFSGKRFIR